MAWSDYEALVAASRAQIDKLQFTGDSRLCAYVELAGGLQCRDVAAIFEQNQLDLREVFALLATQKADPASELDLHESLLPLAVFHLQETSPDLKTRAAELLRRGLQQADTQTYLQGFPGNVLTYLRQNFCQGQPALAAAGHWIDAELSRRTNAYRLETPAKAASAQAGPRRPGAAQSLPATAAVARPVAQAAGPAPAAKPPSPAKPSLAEAPGRPAAPPAAPTSDANAATAAASTKLSPVLGEVALPGAEPKRVDSAILLWVFIIVIVLLILGVLIGALVYLQHLPPAGSYLTITLLYGIEAGATTLV